MTFPPKDPVGEPARAVDWFVKMKDMVLERTILAGPGVKVSQEVNGTRITADLSGFRQRGNVQIRRLVVITVEDDTLECAVDRNSEASVTVLKPWKLQKTPWHGVTVAVPNVGSTGDIGERLVGYNYSGPTVRTAGDNLGNSEMQTIVPAYLESFDFIFAIKVEDSGYDQFKWIDMNTDGRAWARIA